MTGSLRNPQRHVAEKVIPREQLADEIRRVIDDRRLTQAAAARIVNDAPSQISKLLNGQVEGFSTERLIRWLSLLGTDVDITLRPGDGTGPGVVRVRRRFID